MLLLKFLLSRVKPKGRANRISKEQADEAREMVAYTFWYAYVVECKSYPRLGQENNCSTTWAFKQVQEGAKLVARWRSADSQATDLAAAIEQCSYLYRTSKQWFDKGNAKHGAIMARARDMLNKIQGLEKFEVKHTHALAAPDVLDRVKQVAGRVISPLVAEKLPQLQLREAA